ncbi:Mov34/MPN/PAD-1 family protein [Chitinophaga sp. CF118]|uniref:Mov34/MPN/PAD-1 family protein n=1 Tax=Chitinophaga sp. CF118 TaxID=1884367 RepID=UPI0015A53C0A
MTYRKYETTDGLRIQLSEEVFKKIQEHCVRHYPKEFGGIFYGSINSNTDTAMVEDIIVSKWFVNTTVLFRRIAWYFNWRLKQIHRRSNGQLYYIGEWHTHPNAAPFPSTTDLKAMCRIANNPNIRIKTPILLIIGYDGRQINECFYIYLNQNLTSYARL